MASNGWRELRSAPSSVRCPRVLEVVRKIKKGKRKKNMENWKRYTNPLWRRSTLHEGEDSLCEWQEIEIWASLSRVGTGIYFNIQQAHASSTFRHISLNDTPCHSRRKPEIFSLLLCLCFPFWLFHRIWLDVKAPFFPLLLLGTSDEGEPWKLIKGFGGAVKQWAFCLLFHRQPAIGWNFRRSTYKFNKLIERFRKACLAVAWEVTLESFVNKTWRLCVAFLGGLLVAGLKAFCPQQNFVFSSMIYWWKSTMRNI